MMRDKQCAVAHHSSLTCHPSRFTVRVFFLLISRPPQNLEKESEMKKFYTLAAVLVFASAVFAYAAALPARAADDAEPVPAAIGTMVEDFRLPDADGNQHTLTSLKGKNGTVLVFLSIQCPICSAYNDRLVKLTQEYRARGINVVGINANSDEQAAEIKSYVKEKGLNFPVLKDSDNKIADRLGAAHTPEVFFLDASGRIAYHGAIDNSKNPASVNASYLRNAIDVSLAGKPVEHADMKAFGCSIKRVGSM
jgi:peroxiredoxin